MEKIRCASKSQPTTFYLQPQRPSLLWATEAPSCADGDQGPAARSSGSDGTGQVNVLLASL